MARTIEVVHMPELVDAAGDGIRNRLKTDLGLECGRIRVAEIYTIDKQLSDEQLERCRRDLFTDPITQLSSIDIAVESDFEIAIEIGFLPGVTDNVGRTSREGIQDLLGLTFAPGEAVYSARRIMVYGGMDEAGAKRAAGILANPLIHRVAIIDGADFRKSTGKRADVPKVTLAPNPRVDLVDLEVSDNELAKLGSQGILDRVENGKEIRRGPLALDLESLHVIRDHFRVIGRQPTDVELEALAQTWSEHCKHTIFAAKIDDIDSIYKSKIRAATERIRELAGEDDICVSVFTDNSGVVRFIDDWNVCYKVETHNSPSALDPYGGAITGIVGVNRDPLGTGMGSRLIANMYGYCFGDPYYEGTLPTRKPGGDPILHPKVIFEGVRKGVEDGGNKSGIPTVWGFLTFDERYMGKPLVFVGTLGLMPELLHGKPSHEKQALPGDIIVVAGGRVGADGIHGATFSSEGLHSGSPTGAVQIGDPITQKKLGDAQLEARDLGLYRSITDNGAGGLSCSVCEMATESGGCFVELDRVPIKYAGLAPNEIWISESQERMTYAVFPEKLDDFLDLMRRRDVEASVIGKFTDSGKAEVLFDGKPVMDLDLNFLHDGLPEKSLATTYTAPEFPEPDLPETDDLTNDLLSMLATLNLCSREYVSRQYDHEVQGGSVIKPLCGRGQDVHPDAVVVKPILEAKQGVALSSALFPSYGDIDPYAMAACAIDTALRNQVAVGAEPSRVALLDNFCWCSSNDPERLGQLKRTAQACYDTALAYRAPFVSGKDSMFNDFKGYDEKGEPLKISVPPTLLISSVGYVPDVRHCLTPDFKHAGDAIYALGITRDELGASEYYRMVGLRDTGRAFIGKKAPKVDCETNGKLYRKLAHAIADDMVASAASLQQGGLAVALARSCMAGELGADIDLSRLLAEGVDSAAKLLFSESMGRLLVSLAPKECERFEAVFDGLPFAKIGEVKGDGGLVVRNKEKSVCIDAGISAMKQAYKKTLDW